MIESTVNLRERNDQCYSDILNRIRTGNQTNEDIAKLWTRLTCGIPDSVQLDDPTFHSASKEGTNWRVLYTMLIRIIQNQPSVWVYCIQEFHHLSQGVTSQTVPEHVIPTDDNSCAGLPCSLKLAVEMLRQNIMCEYDLVNGVRGEEFMQYKYLVPMELRLWRLGQYSLLHKV